MALKKKKNDGGGVPEWVVTYGDMMSLLLCFFILLAAFSELKKDKYEKVIQAIKEQFGYTGGSGKVPSDELPQLSVIAKNKEVALYKLKFRQLSNSDDPSVYGDETTVQNIREGLKFVVGGMITFEPGRADLKPRAKQELRKLAEVIRGQNNIIEIRGHAVGADMSDGGPFDNMWDLSTARAKAVMDVLTTGDKPIRPHRVRIVGCSDNEPVVQRVYDSTQLAVNRRVEIIVTETLIADVHADESPSSVSLVSP